MKAQVHIPGGWEASNDGPFERQSVKFAAPVLDEF